MFGIQPTHLILIVIVALILFGPQRLPEIGRSLGRSINEFKNASKEMGESFNQAVAEEPKKSNNGVPSEQAEEVKS